MKDKPRVLYHIFHKTPKKIKERIREIAKTKKYSIGQERIQWELRKEVK